VPNELGGAEISEALAKHARSLLSAAVSLESSYRSV
jgi:hypothetical protein